MHPAMLTCSHLLAGAVVSTRDTAADPTPPQSPTEDGHRMALANRRVAELDIFADNVDTILEQQAQGAPVDGPATGNRALLDNFDDPEGYYNFQVLRLGWSVICHEHAPFGEADRQRHVCQRLPAPRHLGSC